MMTILEKILGRKRVLVRENERAVALYKGEVLGILGPGEHLFAQPPRAAGDRAPRRRQRRRSFRPTRRRCSTKLPDVAARHLTVFRTGRSRDRRDRPRRHAPLRAAARPQAGGVDGRRAVDGRDGGRRGWRQGRAGAAAPPGPGQAHRTGGDPSGGGRPGRPAVRRRHLCRRRSGPAFTASGRSASRCRCAPSTSSASRSTWRARRC